jgi:hypothetical protein
MERRLLQERTFGAPIPTSNQFSIDSEAGVMRNVHIHGFSSPNTYSIPGITGTVYTDDCMKKAVPLYDGVEVFADHKDPKTGRMVSESIGVIRKPKYAGDKIIGDFHFRKKCALADMILEDATREDLQTLGMSHNAICGQERVDRKIKKLVIESIHSVKSVDLVINRATGRNLRESTMPTTATPFRTLLESLTKKHTPAQRQAVRTLLEMDGMGDMPVMAEPASDDPDAALMNGFRATINALIDQYEEAEIDAATAGEKIVKLLATHEELVADVEPEDETEEETTGGTETKESVQAQLAELAVRRLCESVQYTPKPAVLRALIALPDDASRRQLIESVNVPTPAPTGQPPLRKTRSGMPVSVGKTTPDAGAALSVLRS